MTREDERSVTIVFILIVSANFVMGFSRIHFQGHCLMCFTIKEETFFASAMFLELIVMNVDSS